MVQRTMTGQFDFAVEKDSEGFDVASMPAPSGCQTQAHRLDELMGRIKEAMKPCL